LNFMLGLLVSEAEAFCLVDDAIYITAAAFVALTVLIFMLFKMGEDIFSDSKSRDDDYPEDDICEIQYNVEIAICRGLDSPSVRSRCYESAMARKIACEDGKPLPPLVTW
ncbi:hypothetical protein ACFLZI_03560, partial [Nitrospirota bacterium]